MKILFFFFFSVMSRLALANCYEECGEKYRACVAPYNEDNSLISADQMLSILPESSVAKITTSSATVAKKRGRDAILSYPAPWKVRISNGYLALTPTDKGLATEKKIEVPISAGKESCKEKYRACTKVCR